MPVTSAPFFLEVAFRHRDRERESVGGNAIIADDYFFDFYSREAETELAMTAVKAGRSVMKTSLAFCS